MKLLKTWLSFLAYKSIMGPYRDVVEMGSSEADEYLADVKYLLDSPALWNEVSRLKSQASEAIVRHTKTNEETAFNRGILVGLEALRKRLITLKTIDRKKK